MQEIVEQISNTGQWKECHGYLFRIFQQTKMSSKNSNHISAIPIVTTVLNQKLIQF